MIPVRSKDSIATESKRVVRSTVGSLEDSEEKAYIMIVPITAVMLSKKLIIRL